MKALLLVPALLLVSQLPAQEPPHHLVEVFVDGPGEMQQLLALDLDLASCSPPRWPQRRIEVIATDTDLATLANTNLQHNVQIRHLEAWHAAQAARYVTNPEDDLTPPIGQGAMGGHYTLAEMVNILDALNQANPNICSVKASIGQSIEGRELWMVKISDNVGTDENEPEVLYDALHHAREPLGLGATLLFMDWLITNYGTDPLATYLVDEREMYFVPCVNPDGYEYNRANSPNGGGMWRKNRRNNGDGTFGVDLNRNYATQWNGPNGGSSTSTNSSTYRGTAPFSEPETTAIDAWAATRSFVTAFNTHTYTDVLLWPYGWTTALPSNAANYDTLGQWLVEENGIPQGSVANELYIARGSSVDHHHEVHGSLAFTPELGKSSEGGFWPVGPTLVDIAVRHQPMFQKLALAAGPAFDLDSITITEAPGGNGNGTVEPGEQGDIVVQVTNNGAAAAIANLTLSPLGPGATIVNGNASLGSVGAFSNGNNAATPLRFAIPAGTTEPVARVRVSLSGDGRTSTEDVVIALVPMRTLVEDDFERDRGFSLDAAYTATTGNFERNAPQATSSGGTPIQTGTQTTPGGSLCWLTEARPGTSAGSYDIDNGYTALLSPILDLSHLAAASAAMDLWYAESQDNDPLTISLSRDSGANWETLYSTSDGTSAWQRLTLDLGQPLTAIMQLRVRAQDLNPSLVECAVDEFAIEAPAAQGALTLLSSGGLGTTLRLGSTAPVPSTTAIFFATRVQPGIPIGGVGGELLLDPAGMLLIAGGPTPASGSLQVDLDIPNDPTIIGATGYFQSLWTNGSQIAFGGNVQSITLN